MSHADTDANTEAMLKETMKMEMMELLEEEEVVVKDRMHVDGKILGNVLGGISVPLVHAQIGIYVRKDM